MGKTVIRNSAQVMGHCNGVFLLVLRRSINDMLLVAAARDVG